MRRRGEAAAVVENECVTVHPDPLAVYILRFYHPEYLGPGPETPAPLETEQIWHVADLI